jgi:hypothetical protein
VHPSPSSAQGAVRFVCWQPADGSQESLVQALPSSQLIVSACWQPLAGSQESLVQALPSSQLIVSACWQPLAGSQESLVQALPSSQLRGVPEQAPAAHRSLCVQALASLHVAVLLA